MPLVRRPRPDAFSDRDLSFHPADPRKAETLTASQLDRFNADGFLSPVPVFDRSEIKSVRGYIDTLLDAVVAADDPRNSYSINGYHVVCRGLWDLATEPRIVALARDLLGPELVCWGTHLFAKLPDDGMEVPFHQDAVYWPFVPAKTVTVWLAIDDVGTDNAPLRWVPASHLGGPVPHEVLNLDGTRVLGRRAIGVDRSTKCSYDLLSAGAVSLHTDLLLHGSEANSSRRRRAGLTLRYAAADVRVMKGFDAWRHAAVHVGVGDPSGYWPNCARPEGEHPDLMAAFWGDFDGQAPAAG